MSGPFGYHLHEIPQGRFGELSKISEELHEAIDAEEQGNYVMVLVELSDMLGAISGYLKNRFGDKITLKDLIVMSESTQRAFENGHRQPKDQ